mmetsp:Transcript_17198/g.36922  ORF Transcript_17198/g.36922 Transcript_17198/m.36922 type:complete len:333 (-) Transcript_17198:113-1111(-)
MRVPCVCSQIQKTSDSRNALDRRALLHLLALFCTGSVSSSLAIARLPAPSRVVAVGDIHGDMQALVDCLELSGLYSSSKSCWMGGDAVLVQLGDILDRGDDEASILDLFRKLKVQAADAGGAVVTMLGNHEVLNALGIMSFVSEAGQTAFGEDRVKAFWPGSPLARELSEWPVFAVIGDTAFCHAGVTLELAKRASEINSQAARWLRGEGTPSLPPVDLMPAPGKKSPIWMRELSNAPGLEPEQVDCDELRAALSVLGASRLVVGHTPQQQINSACDGRVFRIDLGMAKEMGGNVPETLEISDGQVNILTQRGERVPAAKRAARPRYASRSR